ncbi:hypothetical protein ACJ41O_007851 [Fusarium nematophilum]
MIRPRWLPSAKAILAAPRARLLSSNTKDSRWTIPKTASPAQDAQDPVVVADEFAQWRSPPQPVVKLDPAEELSRQKAARKFRKNDGRERHMLIVEGLPTSLRSSDFQRLASRDLSGWGNAVNEAVQERDPWTLEPLGTYYISFSSKSAAGLYEAKLARLLRLAQIKLHSATGLWTSAVPPSLRGSGNPADELANFSLAPGSFPGPLSVHRSRVKGKFPWQRLMDLLVRRSGFTGRPAAVMLQLRHPSISATALWTMIERDGVERGQNWRVAYPYHLVRTNGEDEKIMTKGSLRVPVDDASFRHKLSTRFVVVCESSEIAWRFIRSWNQRTLVENRPNGNDCRTTVTASYLEF